MTGALPTWLSKPKFGVAAVVLGAMLALTCTAQTANAERDPTMPPVRAQAAQRIGAASAPRPDATPRHVMTVNGQRLLIDQGRRLAVGDLLGAARIERIDDGAVWLREDGVLRQVSLFGGIVKRPVNATATAAASAPPSINSPVSKTSVTTGATPRSTPPTSTGKRS